MRCALVILPLRKALLGSKRQAPNILQFARLAKELGATKSEAYHPMAYIHVRIEILRSDDVMMMSCHFYTKRCICKLPVQPCAKAWVLLQNNLLR